MCVYILSEQVKGNINVLMISETKVNDSFPIGNFGISIPYHSDRDSKGGGIYSIQSAGHRK